jgi:hypothetical protein
MGDGASLSGGRGSVIGGSDFDILAIFRADSLPVEGARL